jgi:hypothetical protein
MMSQRGATCASDTLFTLLFESEFLRPLFYSPDWESIAPTAVADDDCCILLPTTPVVSLLSSEKLITHFNKNLAVKRDALRNQYIGVLSAAKKRYDRMISRGNYSKLNRTRNRRSLSVENTLWEEMHYPITPVCSTSPFLRGGDVAIFLDFLLTTNGMKLPALEAKNPFQVQFYSPKDNPPPAGIETKNIIALVLLITPVVKSKTDFSQNHYIGLYRNEGTWFLVDNEVGYIHQIMDTDWVNKIMLPRLFYTVSHPVDSYPENTKDAEHKLFVNYYDSELKPFFTNYQFITFGERSYPNINPCSVGDPLYFFIPEYVCSITMSSAGTMSTTGVTTGGGSAATRRRQTRRQRRRVGK